MVLILLVYAGIIFLSLWNSSLDFVSVFELDCLLLFRLSGSLQGFPRGLALELPWIPGCAALGSWLLEA